MHTPIKKWKWKPIYKTSKFNTKQTPKFRRNPSSYYKHEADGAAPAALKRLFADSSTAGSVSGPEGQLLEAPTERVAA